MPAEPKLHTHFRLELGIVLDLRVPLLHAVEKPEAAAGEILDEANRRVDDLKAVLALWLARGAQQPAQIRGTVKVAAPFAGHLESVIQIGEAF